MLAREETDKDSFRRSLKKVERVVEWAHNGALLAFGEVWAAWTYLLPDVIHIGDDIVRGSPMLLLGQVSRRLDDHLAGENPVRHAIFGETFTTEVRALNPGLALGTLRVAPQEGGYARDELVERAYGHGHHITERTVDSHVRRIRKKFSALGVDPIETVHGVGYRMRSRSERGA